jgi:hypothetical protein
MSGRAVTGALLTAALAFTAVPLGPVGPSVGAEQRPDREAAVGWTPPTRVFPPGRRAYEPMLAASPEGDVTVVWSVGDGRILSRTKQRGGAWGPLRQVGRGYVEDVESDASGAVTAVWTRGAGGGRNVVMAATRPDGGAWSRPRRISRIPRSVGTFTQHGPVELEVSPGGTAVAGWTLGSEHGGARYRPEANYRPPGGRWGRPVRIGPLDTQLKGLAISPTGVPSALVNVGPRSAVHLVRRLEGRWRAVGRRVGRRNASEYQLAIGPSGHTVLAVEYYRSLPNGPDRYWVEGTRLVDGRWTRAVRLSRRANAYGSRVGVDRAGVATVTWGNSRGRVQVTRWSPGHVQRRPHTLARRNAGNVAPAVAPNGATVAVWTSSTRRGRGAVVASTRSPGGAWSTPRVINGRQGVGYHELHGAVGIWPRGRAVVTWPAERDTAGIWISWKR